MNDEQTHIFGYFERGCDTALCVLCTQIVYAYSLHTALGHGMIEAIRHEHAEQLSETLRCVKCGQAILAPVSADPTRLDVFREYVERTDLGGDL
jgi:hypothetical protein